MKRKNKTRGALFSSVLSLLLCVSMLVGTTFAWFTDSVTSSGNKIQSGNLKVDLELLEGDEWSSIKDSQDPIFFYDKWEPGYVDVKVLKIENEGSLALKWYAKFQADGELSILANVIDVYVLASQAEIGYPTDRALTGYTRVGTVAEFVNTIETTTYGSLMPKGVTGDVAYLGIALKMQETAGNEYQNLSIGGNGGFDIMILATQETYEKDSFNTLYDASADFGYYEGTGNLVGNLAVIDVTSADNTKIATVEVPVEAVADENEEIKVTVTPTALNGDVTVEANESAKTYDVSVSNIKETTNARIRVELNVGKGLSGVKVYHKATELTEDVSYNANTGYVSFYTSSFSPYTIVYDAVYNPGTNKDTFKAALKTYSAEEIAAVNAELKWETYGGLSPASAEQKLEAVYSFTAPHTSETIADCAYKNWICDFYVKIENVPGDPGTLAEGALTLGGNYGNYGWVGFDSPEVEVGVEYPLLQSVGGAWTYEAIATGVQVFLCGVAEADYNEVDLSGAQFTVILRLTNPDNTGETIDTNTVTYTFE